MVAAALPAIQKVGRGCGAQSMKSPSKVGWAFALALNTRACPGEEACLGAGVTRLAGREAGEQGQGGGEPGAVLLRLCEATPHPGCYRNSPHPC